MALTEDNISTTTLQLIRKRLADNIFKANPFGAWMLMRGRVELENGGKRLDEPLIYASNPTVQSYLGYDRLNISPTEELTNAQFSWRQGAVSIGISGLEELQNSGAETQVFNLLRTKVRIAEMSLKQYFAEKLLANVSTKDTARDILGLDELVEDVVGGSQGIVGGIDRSAESWWQNKFIDNTGDAWGTSVTKLKKHMTTLYYEVTKGLTQPDLILTDQATFERYEDDGFDKLRLSDQGLMDLGFTNFKFKNATMMWDENIQVLAPSTQHLLYMLNSEFLRFVLHTRRNFAMTQFVSPIDQDARVAQILFAGQTTINNSRFQGVMKEAE